MAKELYTLITGASEGFGKAMALECARRGMNLVLVALPGDELVRLSQFIEREFLVKTICLPHDLTNKEECICLSQEISEKNIRLNCLINNAGLGGTHYFKERDTDFYRRQIELNVIAPTMLTYLLLDNLEQNGPSRILNVSSLAGFFYLPTKQVYGGTKSYLLSFSKSLRSELKSKNVWVSTVCPGGMNTTLLLVLQNRELTGISRWSVMNPEDVAIQAIDGMLRGKQIIIPGYWNRFFLLLNKILPAWLKTSITERKLNRSTASKPASCSIAA